jgi:hypothetical protein
MNLNTGLSLEMIFSVGLLTPQDGDSLLDITTDGRQLIVAPARPSARRKRFDAAQEWAHQRYGKTFQKLAE